jgi:CheY-like chemotaxis protein
LATEINQQFRHVAQDRNLEFAVNIADDVPESFTTDPQRLNQIIKNLLSNALKFTENGSVTLNISSPQQVPAIMAGHSAVAFAVRDTGIGMTPDQQKIVFEAFQQADGSTSRRYGGTGLGLSISRELATKLGGIITLASQVDEGSTFTLYLPVDPPEQSGEQVPSGAALLSSLDQQAPAPMHGTSQAFGRNRAGTAGYAPGAASASGNATSGNATSGNANGVSSARGSGAGANGASGVAVAEPPVMPIATPKHLPDDREKLDTERATLERVLLVVEDDLNFAKVMLNLGRKQDFTCLHAPSGEEGLRLAEQYNPSAIVLDLHLPTIDGWQVLDALKRNPNTRHIPVHIASIEDETLDAYKRGAVGYLSKPVNQESLQGTFDQISTLIAKDIKTLLIVEDDAASRISIKKLLGSDKIDIREAELGETALELLKQHPIDCMILDLNLPDMTGFDVLTKMGERKMHCPVIVYTGQELSPEEHQKLMRYTDSIIVKGVKSPERLLDETALFLHQVVADMPEDKQNTIQKLYNTDDVLKEKQVLIVDDDMRNTFAMSKILKDGGMEVNIAKDGQKALDYLDAHPDTIDIVLMDIMMPIMDGFETMKRIRQQARFKHLPILALTAKAMQGDKQKCLDAGANDYLSKPVDTHRLLSMMRVWLYL